MPEAESLGRQAYCQLRDRILAGKLQPGERLSLRGMANSLGMSMAPVGEALRELSRDGLVELEPGWGTRVRQLDAESLHSQHVLRTALECEAARQCAVRASESQLAELFRLAESLDEAIDSHSSPEQVSELDSRFHLQIAELAKAPSLVQALRSNQLVRLLARGSEIAHHVNRPAGQHVVLVKALQSRDPAVAEDAMRQHCLESMRLQMQKAGFGNWLPDL
ncbi:MAG: GntR family transcriptional regulator [Planctomycetaceae bacterium]